LATRAVEFAGGPANVGGIRMFHLETADLYSGPIIPVAAEHAREADETRSLNPAVLTAVRQSDVLALSASPRIGGHGADIGTIGRELEALAGACASTAWCVWNHLCVFHLFCGVLGPDHAELLAAIVDRHEWVCFPAGAGSGILAADEGDSVQLSGHGAFGSGARYADWAGVAFAMAGPDGGARRPLDLRFTVVRLDQPGVSIDATWDGAALRASSTDDVHYRGVAVPLTRCAPWYGADRANKLRDADAPMIDRRYREDWVGLSALWLGAMACGVVAAALDDLVEEVGRRRAIMGRPMAELPGVHFNLGRAAAALLGARAAVAEGCAAVDGRMIAGGVPSEGDELQQAGRAAFALDACNQAMQHLLKVAGGNGLRQRHPFERRYRDFQAMPLHINAHEDRVTERLGRHLLGLPIDPF
jgi:3-hydroxy-9,10-secoandrosta-1,3,5(10)-triene-9,17-dione monooxygenase